MTDILTTAVAKALATCPCHGKVINLEEHWEEVEPFLTALCRYGYQVVPILKAVDPEHRPGAQGRVATWTHPNGTVCATGDWDLSGAIRRAIDTMRTETAHG